METPEDAAGSRRLVAMLSREGAEIVREWEHAVRTRERLLPLLSGRIEVVLRAISELARLGSPEKVPQQHLDVAPMPLHVLERLELGTDVGELVAEYALLREILITKLLARPHEETLAFELRVINRVIDQAVQTTVRQERERFTELVDNLDHAVVWEADVDNLQFSFVSARAQMLTDFSPTEWMATPDFLRRQVPSEDHEALFGMLERARNGDDTARCNHRLARKNGSLIWVHTGVHCLKRAASRVFQGVTLDVTDLQNAVRSRDELLAVVSHDLRNPLGTIALNAANIAHRSQGDVAGRSKSAADAILRATRRMDRLIDDLLDFASIQAGRLSVMQRQEQLCEILEEVTATMQSQAEEHGLVLSRELPEDLPFVHCDRERVMQVFANLLSNAFKITPAGGVVSVGAQQGRQEVIAWVKDTGPGIAEHELAHLFERYYRGPSSAYKGSGLGLAIVRGIIGAHGGRCWVESSPGKGATFFIALPEAVTSGT